MTRLHEKRVAATMRDREELVDIVAPTPGLFRTALRSGDIVRAGSVLGELEILGQLVVVVAPDGAHGAIVDQSSDLARRPVDHGGVLFVIDPRAASAGADREATAAKSATTTTGLVFRAPTSGRFYGRPSPGKPAFVEQGSELAIGATVCLLEVMKTFHRVHYGGAGLPERVRVREVLVVDGADVNAGDALLALDPL